MDVIWSVSRRVLSHHSKRSSAAHRNSSSHTQALRTHTHTRSCCRGLTGAHRLRPTLQVVGGDGQVVQNQAHPVLVLDFLAHVLQIIKRAIPWWDPSVECHQVPGDKERGGPLSTGQGWGGGGTSASS